MPNLKRAVKRMLESVSKRTPRNVKNHIVDIFSALSGTRQLREYYNKNQGEIERYGRLLDEKSDVTEYRVDKIIRTVGQELIDQKVAIDELMRRITNIEEKIGIGKPDKD